MTTEPLKTFSVSYEVPTLSGGASIIMLARDKAEAERLGHGALGGRSCGITAVTEYRASQR